MEGKRSIQTFRQGNSDKVKCTQEAIRTCWAEGRGVGGTAVKGTGCHRTQGRPRKGIKARAERPVAKGACSDRVWGQELGNCNFFSRVGGTESAPEKWGGGGHEMGTEARSG